MIITRFLEWANDWKSHLPKEITIHDGKTYTFKLGNIMEPSNMQYQITYDDPTYGFPDTLEIDIYRITVDGKLKIDVDITCGDFMVFSFSIKDGTISMIEDPKKFWGTEKYCIDDKSIRELSQFFSYITGTNFDMNQFDFLCPLI